MDRSFYGHKRQTNSLIAFPREGILAPVTFSSPFLFGQITPLPVPGIETPDAISTARQGLQGSQQNL